MSEVRRETTFTNEPDEVWHEIGDEDKLERWLGEEVTVEEVEDGSRIVFTWARPGEDESRVELTVSPDPDGARLIVVERLPGTTGPMASAAAWNRSLTALHDCLELVLA